MQIIINITDDEQRILEHWLGEGGIEPWVRHALENKIRQRVDAAVLEYTDMNPKKMSKTDKLNELSKITLPVRED